MRRMRARILLLTALPLLALLGLGRPAIAVDNFSPNPVNVTLPAGGSVNVPKTLHLDALPGAADIIIAIDTTGSMGPAINQAKAEATQLVNDIQAAIPGARFAVVDFKDYSDGAAVYVLKTPGFTPSAAAVQGAINTMTPGGGGDFAEAYNRVFAEAVSDPALVATRNPDAAQFLVVLGDAPPHDATQTAAPACGDRPPDDPAGDTGALLAALDAADITLLMIRYQNFIPLACYQQLAEATGGTAVNGGGGETLSDQIIAGIQAAAASIEEVRLVVSPACPLGVSFTPPNSPPYGPFTAPVDINFTETLTAPTLPGVYSCTVTAVVDGTPRAEQTINVTVTPGPPATITLTPATADNLVDSQHCVTATVRDAFDNLVPGATVNFGTTGSTSANGSAVTGANGQASFCYTGPALPGSDVITATAQGGTNPTATAAKNWLIPPSTPGCKVNTGGRITAANGDKATFGGNVKADGAKGQIEYQDHGPAVDMNVHSIEVLSVVCSPDGTSASIFGTATVNGSGTYDFRVDVRDLGEPGKTDTYRIRLSNGYDSGVRVLDQGNIQIHK